MKRPAGLASALPSLEMSLDWEGAAELRERVPGRWGINKHDLQVTSTGF